MCTRGNKSEDQKASLHHPSWTLGEKQGPLKTLSEGRRKDHCHSGTGEWPLLVYQSEHELPTCPLAYLTVDKNLLKGSTWLGPPGAGGDGGHTLISPNVSPSTNLHFSKLQEAHV